MASLTMALLTVIVLLLVSFLPRHAIAQLRPNCVSQITLANQACALVPISIASVDQNHTRVHATSDDDDDGDEESERPHRGEHGNGRGHRHGNGRGRRNGHRHGGGHIETPRTITDCCQWVGDVDDLCVCSTLIRIPAFLVRLRHDYKVSVGNTCSRTFKCPGI